MLLKDMGESFILSEDEPLTPNFDGVMALWIFRRRAQTAKNWRKSAKIGPLDSSVFLSRPPGGNPFKPLYPKTTEVSVLGWKGPVQNGPWQGAEKNP